MICGTLIGGRSETAPLDFSDPDGLCRSMQGAGVFYTRIPHLAQTSDAVNRQLSCFSSRYMNLLAVFQI